MTSTRPTRILDDKLRIGLLNKIDARLAKAVPAIPLFQGGWRLGAEGDRTRRRPERRGLLHLERGRLVARALA